MTTTPLCTMEEARRLNSTATLLSLADGLLTAVCYTCADTRLETVSPESWSSAFDLIDSPLEPARALGYALALNALAHTPEVLTEALLSIAAELQQLVEGELLDDAEVLSQLLPMLVEELKA